MSLDLEVWSVEPLSTLAGVSEPLLAKQRSGWFRADRNWQIIVEESVEVDESDVPQEVSMLHVGIRFLTRLELEPISAPRFASSLLRSAKIFAKLIL